MSGKSFLSLIVSLLVLSTCSFAAAEGPNNSLDELERGTVQRDSLDPEEVVDSSYAQQLARDIYNNCSNGKCSVASISIRNKGVSFNMGCGEGGLNGAGGTNYYIGGQLDHSKSSGTNCYAGFTIKNEKCSASFNIPESDFVNFVRTNLAQRVEGSVVGMNRLTPEYEFQKRIQLEFARTLQNACGNK